MPDATANFRSWLRAKYRTIDRLNEDWGTSFWSMPAIRISTRSKFRIKTITRRCPSHAQLDFARFFADEGANFLRLQTQVLRQFGGQQWITTNFMSMHGDIDPMRSAKDLDAFTWTIYPAHGEVFSEYGPLRSAWVPQASRASCMTTCGLSTASPASWNCSPDRSIGAP